MATTEGADSERIISSERENFEELFSLTGVYLLRRRRDGH